MKKVITVVLIFLLSSAMTVSVLGARGNGGNSGVVGNNLSFPVLAVDGFEITEMTDESFDVEYAGEYTGLSDEEIAYVLDNGPWYAQKVQGNSWQADYAVLEEEVYVDEIDWGDLIEVVNPVYRRPFRLELVLYKNLVDPMMEYEMALLANPSSADEIQGTNTTKTPSYTATVISKEPKLVIQYYGENNPADLNPVWDATEKKWSGETPLEMAVVTFGSELNVAGKYILGAASGGWKPMEVGYYRITVYIPDGSNVKLDNATIKPIEEVEETDGDVTISEGDEENRPEMGTQPVVDPINNLTYADVHVDASTSKTKNIKYK